MNRLLIILLGVMLLAACSSNKEESVADEPIVEEPKQDEVIDSVIGTVDQEETNDEIETNPLPFNTDEFIESYSERIKGFEGLEDSMNLSIKENYISLTFGDVIEAQVLLNTLSEFAEAEAINELASEMVLDLVEDGYYINEEIINGFDIKINAVDVSSVMVVVTNETE